MVGCAMTSSNLIGLFWLLRNLCLWEDILLYLKGYQMLLGVWNFVETGLVLLYLWMKTRTVQNVVCFCLATKHCISYRFDCLQEEAFCVWDVKKWLYTCATRSIPNAFVYTSWTLSHETCLIGDLTKRFLELLYGVLLSPFWNQICILVVFACNSGKRPNLRQDSHPLGSGWSITNRASTLLDALYLGAFPEICKNLDIKNYIPVL